MADINLAQTLLTETDVSRQLRVSLAALRKWRVINWGHSSENWVTRPVPPNRSRRGLPRFPSAAAMFCGGLCQWRGDAGRPRTGGGERTRQATAFGRQGRYERFA